MAIIRCAVTGALGNVGYSLAFFVASGMLFGPNQKIALHLLEVPELAGPLEGLRMELEDCAFPTLQEIRTGTDPFLVFQDIDYALLAGAKPRGPGMERKDLIQANGHIFQHQGKALDAAAKRDVKVLVVGNPCNTNCLIALHNAPSLDNAQFSALTCLDELRARALLAKKLHVNVESVSPVVIWGNHSTTLVPDTSHTMVDGTPVSSVADTEWLEEGFVTSVRQRGVEVIKARGKSSAASAALAAIFGMKSLLGEGQELFSMAVFSQKNSYGIDKDLVFSFPCRLQEKSPVIVPNMRPSQALWEKVLLSEKELIEERDSVRHLFQA
jgi:malate dehydrogenase